MVWPVLAVVGFLVLMAVVIALGTRSTALYEMERQDQAGSAPPATQSSGGGRGT